MDASRGGWVAVAVTHDETPAVSFHRTLAEVVAAYPEATCIGVDIPIGLPAAEPRPADRAAQAFVGARRSSVFLTPPRACLTAPNQGEATRIGRELGFGGVSAQAFAMRHRVFDAAPVAATDERVHEVHPEVSFCELNGAPLPWAKKTWAGFWLRHRLLLAAGIEIPITARGAAASPADDVLDAAVAAWSARRIASAQARWLPADALPDRTPRIWY